MIEEAGTRTKLLNLWASDFLHRYVPDEEGASEVKLMFHQLAYQEEEHGRKLTTDPYYLEVPRINTYLVGEVLANIWEIPITQMGLVFLIMGCHEANHVRMLLSAVYAQHLRSGATSKTPLDVEAIGAILKKGTATSDLLQSCWDAQKVPVKLDPEQHESEINLLDCIVAQDFNRM